MPRFLAFRAYLSLFYPKKDVSIVCSILDATLGDYIQNHPFHPFVSAGVILVAVLDEVMALLAKVRNGEVKFLCVDQPAFF